MTKKITKIKNQLNFLHVEVTKGKIIVTVKRKFQGKSVLVRVSARFESAVKLVRVRVMRSQLCNTFPSLTFLQLHTLSHAS